MKKAILTATLFAAPFFAVGVGSANTPPAQPTIKLLSVRPPATYEGGAYRLELEIQSMAPHSGNVTVKLDSGNTSLDTQIIAMVGTTAATTKYMSVGDPAGLSSCKPKTYTVSLIPAGGVAVSQLVEVTPHCALASAIRDEWNQLSPDNVDATKKDNVYLTNAVLESAPTCQGGPKIKADIVNNSKLSSPSLVVQLKSGETVSAQTAAAFALPAGAGKTVVATPVVPAADVPDSQTLVITDWTHALGTHIATHTIEVTTKRHCTLVATLIDQSAIPR
jgi:hypothetical protein